MLLGCISKQPVSCSKTSIPGTLACSGDAQPARSTTGSMLNGANNAHWMGPTAGVGSVIKFLREEEIDCLVACNWPCLTSLNLARSELDANAIHSLISGDWPLLQNLCVCDNMFCVVACWHLARGAWPQLSRLDLSCCGINTCCFHHLLNGCWPGLEVSYKQQLQA